MPWPCDSFGAGGFGDSAFGTGPYGSGPYGTGATGNFINYYVSLLTSEYQGAVKLKAFLASVLSIIGDINVLLCQMASNFDVNTAIGVQLDLLGILIGVSRTVGFQPSGGVSPILDDATYRVVLKAKIAQNQWDGQASSLYAIWAGLFPGGKLAIQDNQNMTATIFISGAFTSILQDLINNGYIVPRPETVQYTFVSSNLPAFGFDLNNAFVAGFDLGSFA